MAYAPPRVSGSRVAKATKKQPPASDMLRLITRSMTTDASRKAVFNTTELLEKIISFLPPFDILTKTQKVSPVWKETIDNSPTVQSLLWRPRGIHTLSPSAHSHQIEATRDDERAKVDLENDDYRTSSVAALATGVPKYSEAVAFNELFFTGRVITGYHGDYETLALSVETTPIGYMHTAEMEWAYDVNVTSHDGTRQTWVDKYITSPPITVAQMGAYVHPEYHGRGTRGYKWVYATVYDPHGITYGTTAEVLKKLTACERPKDPEQKYFGWTSLCFVTEALASSSTIVWTHSDIRNWDKSRRDNDGNRIGTEQQLSGFDHYDQLAKLRTS
jgi:hypothetical protein